MRRESQSRTELFRVENSTPRETRRRSRNEETRGWRARGSIWPMILWLTMTVSVSHADRLRDPDSELSPSYLPMVRYCYLDRYGRLFLISGREKVYIRQRRRAHERERSIASEDFGGVNCGKMGTAHPIFASYLQQPTVISLLLLPSPVP